MNEVDRPTHPLLGFQVIESRSCPSGDIYVTGRMLTVRDQWQDLRLPLMLAEMRRQARDHLYGLVRAAELRLGLEDSLGVNSGSDWANQ